MRPSPSRPQPARTSRLQPAQKPGTAARTPRTPRTATVATAAAAFALALSSCTTSVPPTPETTEPDPSPTPEIGDPVPLDSFDLTGLTELGYVHNPDLLSENLTQWQSPGCKVQALVAPTPGSGDDAADSSAAFGMLGPEFQDLEENGWVRLPLTEGGTLTMSVRTGTFDMNGTLVPVDIAARSVGEVHTLFVITHTCSEDAPNPTTLEDVIPRIILNGVLNPDA